ncbi:hypothetical protein ACWEPN_32485 [Nonomuraea wenchangensis]
MITGWIAFLRLIDALKDYRNDGFNLIPTPPDSGVDAALAKGDLTVYLQVRTRNTGIRADRARFTVTPSIDLAISENRARLDLLWLPSVSLTSIEEVAARIDIAREIAHKHPEPAFLLCFATIEAALSRLTYSTSPLPDSSYPTTDIYRLLDRALIEEQDFVSLTQALSVRNHLAHGRFSNVEVRTQDVMALADIAARLNTSVTSKAIELLDALIRISPATVDFSAPFVEQLLNNSANRFPRDIISRAAEIIRETVSPD